MNNSAQLLFPIQIEGSRHVAINKNTISSPSSDRFGIKSPPSPRRHLTSPSPPTPPRHLQSDSARQWLSLNPQTHHTQQQQKQQPLQRVSPLLPRSTAVEPPVSRNNSTTISRQNLPGGCAKIATTRISSAITTNHRQQDSVTAEKGSSEVSPPKRSRVVVGPWRKSAALSQNAESGHATEKQQQSCDQDVYEFDGE